LTEGTFVTLSIAVAGKGGTGKTSLSSLFVRTLLARQVRPVLAVDADPNSNLAEALGVAAGRPLAEIREQCSSPEGSPQSGMGRVRAVQDEIQRAISEADGFDLITMGRPEGPRCYCYVNNLLRTSVDALTHNYSAVVLDNEAGLEHLSRRTTNDVDFLLAVMDPTLPAFRAVQRILLLARELPIKIGRLALVVNRVGPQGVPQELVRQLDQLDVQRLPDVPQDDALEQAGALGRHVFTLQEQSPAVVAVGHVMETLFSAASSAAASSLDRLQA
jgi:CO dehydrogenase maturation factor